MQTAHLSQNHIAFSDARFNVTFYCCWWTANDCKTSSEHALYSARIQHSIPHSIPRSIYVTRTNNRCKMRKQIELFHLNLWFCINVDSYGLISCHYIYQQIHMQDTYDQYIVMLISRVCSPVNYHCFDERWFYKKQIICKNKHWWICCFFASSFVEQWFQYLMTLIELELHYIYVTTLVNNFLATRIVKYFYMMGYGSTWTLSIPEMLWSKLFAYL